MHNSHSSHKTLHSAGLWVWFPLLSNLFLFSSSAVINFSRWQKDLIYAICSAVWWLSSKDPDVFITYMLSLNASAGSLGLEQKVRTRQTHPGCLRSYTRYIVKPRWGKIQFKDNWDNGKCLKRGAAFRNVVVLRFLSPASRSDSRCPHCTSAFVINLASWVFTMACIAVLYPTIRLLHYIIITKRR